MLEKNQTGIASEFYVAGELSRLGLAGYRGCHQHYVFHQVSIHFG